MFGYYIIYFAPWSLVLATGLGVTLSLAMTVMYFDIYLFVQYKPVGATLAIRGGVVYWKVWYSSWTYAPS